MRNLPRHSTTSLVATSKSTTRHSVSNGGHEATSPNEDKDKRKKSLQSLTRETWRPGTKKALVVIAALTLTTCLGIFLIRMMYWVKFVAVSNFCTTDACHAYSKNLLESINKSVDPCQSFTQFVCGGWEQKHLSSVRETHIFDILDNLRRTARAMEIPVRGQSEAQRAAKLFLSCDDVLNGRSDQLRAVKRALESAGIVWPEQPSKADALHTLLHSSLVLGWGTLLDFVIVRSPHQDALVIKAGRALLLVIDHTRGFKTEAARVSYFTQLWGSFQRDHSGHGTVTVSYEDTVVIESLCMERLAKLYFTHERGSVLSQLEKVKDINGTRMTVNRWLTNLAILNITFPKGIHLTTTTSEYFGAVLDLWAELGEGRFHLLVSWCTVQVAALYANQELISNFYAHSPKMATTYHGIFCVSRTMYLSAHTLFSSYDADILQSDAGEDAQATILSVREAFRRRLMKWAYSDPNVTVVSNWSSLEAVFRNFAATNYTSPFGDFSDMTDSLADNWHKVTQLAGGATGTFAMPYLVYRLHYHVVLPDEQDFQLMPYALSFPLFHDELTAAINYGGLGAVVSRALGRLFIDAYETAGPALARRIEMVLNCVYGQAPTDEDTGVDTRAEAFGMSAVVDAYKNVDPPDQSVSGLEEYTGTQLFFIALCYHKCRGRAKRNLETVCDIPFKYFPEFAAAFRCDPRTSMHPLQRCGLF
ncbi:hypothetical protein V5799_000674 [Amblyomma americanum]|uniref:Peptidase M13 N-terminal domain-containing protein n=1 Tax=Amblyomma americanum TaxID=6943 RepID=A0AAQ4D2D6_AMBAM